MPSPGVTAPVVLRGLHGTGGVEAPPYEMSQTVGWYGAGTAPGAQRAALLVGHADTETRPAVFDALGTTRPGAVVRAGGALAEFTVEDVRVFSRHEFDAHQVYGRAIPGAPSCGSSPAAAPSTGSPVPVRRTSWCPRTRPPYADPGTWRGVPRRRSTTGWAPVAEGAWMYDGRGARMRAGVVAVGVTAALLAVGCTSGPGDRDPDDGRPGGGARVSVEPGDKTEGQH